MATPERGRLFLIDVDMQLRRVVERIRPDARQQRVARRECEELLACLHQGVVADAGTIFHLDIEAGGLSQLVHRRRHQREHLRVADFRELSHRRCVRSLPRLSAAPVRPLQSFRCTKQMAVFCPAPAKLKPAIMKAVATFVFLLDEKEMLDLFGDSERARLCGAVGQRDLRDDRALVLLGQKRRRQAQEQQHEHHDDACIDQQGRPHPIAESARAPRR